MLEPEARKLLENWDNYTLEQKVEQASYIVGKLGGNICIPAGCTKAIAQGVRGAKELVILAKNCKRTEQVLMLEALAETGGRTGEFAEVVYKTRIREGLLPQASDLFNKITNNPPIKSKIDFFNIFLEKETLVGLEGSTNRIRLFRGGENEANNIFNALTKNGELYYKEAEKIIYKLPEDIYVTYRSFSKSGPPTIDIKLPNTDKNIKLKFIE